MEDAILTPRRRPLVRYYGGKWQIAPWIVSHMPKHRIYVEAYGGGGSVLLRKQRSYGEVYNDLDEMMVNLFRVARDRGDELRRLLELTPFSRRELQRAQAIGNDADDVTRAWAVIVRAFMGFGSDAVHKTTTGFRSNSNRSGTTPAHDWRSYPDALDATIQRLRGVVIECRDALDVIRQHDGPETLIYLDPPYLHSVRRNVDRDRYGYEMSDDDHERMLHTALNTKGMVMISGYHSALYDDALRGWYRVERGTYAGSAKPRTEVLWISPEAMERSNEGGT